MLLKEQFGRLKDELSHGPPSSRDLRNDVWVPLKVYRIKRVMGIIYKEYHTMTKLNSL